MITGLLRRARLAKLMAKYARLHVAGRMIVVIIEADFSPGDHARIPRQAFQFRVVRFRRMPCLVRVNSRRGVNPIVRLGVRNGRSQLFDFRAVADRQQRADSRSPRSIEHGVAIRVKVGYVHVRV